MPHIDHDDTKNHSMLRLIAKVGLVAAISAIWIAYRSGTKPTRISYPCQQAALSNIETFKSLLLALVPSIASIKAMGNSLKPVAILVALVFGSMAITSNFTALNNYALAPPDNYNRVPIDLMPNTAITSESASDIFLVGNASGLEGNMDPAIDALLNLMESNNLDFYESSSTPSGLIGSNDVVILKVNGQWNNRGGTNTDLVKSVINAIVNHPDGFTGEVVIADNGQGLGNMDFTSSNAFYHNQSMDSIATSFSTHRVSTYLWDDIRQFTVDEYDEGDLTSGYVLNYNWNVDTHLFVSYPKFRTVYGTYISFKNGIWNNETGFDSDRLKVINMPVLKSHFRYGVTGSVKNYMGLPKGYIVSDISYDVPHEHFSIALGGMGTLMLETRAPILNILDMIWINAHPMESSTRRGPWSSYSNAVFTDIIGVSSDPVALDYWASKNILCAAAEYLNYTVYSSLDPDYAPLSDQYYGVELMDESFHNYLNRTRVVLNNGGRQATMNTDEMNVYITALNDNPLGQTSSTTPETPTPPTTTTSGDIWLQALIVGAPISAALIVIVALIRRNR
ncbi:MAG: DUF362 domain-containing protein [Candidatus Thorarchaeota archaeon]